MPPVRRKYKPKPDEKAAERFHDAMEEVRQEDVTAFMSGMCRNAKGTLWKRFPCGTTVSIFLDKYGREGYVVCVTEPDQPPSYLEELFESEEEAVAGLLGQCILARLYGEGKAIDNEIYWMK